MRSTLKAHRRLSLLPATYFAKHQDNRMQGKSDVAAARDRFLANRPGNLEFLLRHRYEWMNPYLSGLENVVEVGSGAGFSREFISNPRLKLTDVVSQAWLDETVDALQMPYADRSIDAILCNQVIHHFAKPVIFLREVSRVLKPNGILLIQEPYTSFLLKMLLKGMRKEGWSYAVDVFDEHQLANDPSDPWSGNNAIPELLFSDSEQFEKMVPGLKLELCQHVECFLFPLSGGVTAKTKTIPLPNFILRIVQRFDQFLISILPDVFALGIRAVVRQRL